MEKQCIHCGAVVNAQDKYCVVCGKTLQKQSIPCTADAKPLTVWEYVLLFLVTAIPIVNIIMLCIWAFRKEENQNRKNFARAALVFVGVGTVVGVIVMAVFWQVILYGIAFETQKWDIDDRCWYYHQHHHTVPPQDRDWLQNQELLDEAFTTSKTDTHIKQIWVHESGTDIL